MFERDFEAFSSLLDDCAVLLGKPAVGPRHAALYFRLLSSYSIDAVTAAFEAHLRDSQRGRFFPTPADILAQFEAAAQLDERPSGDEAWAIAIKAADEACTVVWTDEIAEAWGIARKVFEGGDEVGARMAFRDAYKRLVEASRGLREPVRWTPSVGHDITLRDEAMTRAVEDGRLPIGYLPAPVGPVVGLIELTQVRGIPEGIKERLDQIRRQISTEAEPERGRDWLEKQRTNELKAAAAARVQRLKDSGGLGE